MYKCGQRCAVWGALVRRCVEEGALLWVRGGEDVWTKVRCGGGGRMGVEGRKFVGAGAGVRRCVEEGVLLWVRKLVDARAGVRRCGEEGALFGVRWCEDVWRKVRWCGGAVVVRGRLRYAVGGRKYVQKVAHIRIYWGAGAREQVRNNIFTIM